MDDPNHDTPQTINYIVVCLDQGTYYLATRQVFATRATAEAYAGTIAEAREPLVITGRFHQLRTDSTVRKDTKLKRSGLCPICGEHITITMLTGRKGQFGYLRTMDGRLIGSCQDAFTDEQWKA